MHKKTIFSVLMVMAVAVILGACNKKNPAAEEGDAAIPEEEFQVKNDSMLYGLCCDGTSDSVVVIWPFHGDPVVLSCLDAKREGRIIGKPEIGDWIGVMKCDDDTTEASMVIDLDGLKGTWTYPVMPVMKDLQHMSKRMQKRMMADMPDSVREMFFVPREYGFTLKRSHVAQAVGHVMRKTTLEDDSPVTYPEVKRYKGWYMSNGRLLLVSGDRAIPGIKIKEKHPDEVDTLEFEYMDNDSLILIQHGIRYGFHRKASSLTANEAATKALQKSGK